MFAIAFDLVVADVRTHRGDVSGAYKDVRDILEGLGFVWTQGSLYTLDKEDMSILFQAIMALRNLSWFPLCVRDIRAFRVEQWSDFTTMVRGGAGGQQGASGASAGGGASSGGTPPAPSSSGGALSPGLDLGNLTPTELTEGVEAPAADVHEAIALAQVGQAVPDRTDGSSIKEAMVSLCIGAVASESTRRTRSFKEALGKVGRAGLGGTTEARVGRARGGVATGPGRANGAGSRGFVIGPRTRGDEPEEGRQDPPGIRAAPHTRG